MDDDLGGSRHVVSLAGPVEHGRQVGEGHVHERGVATGSPGVVQQEASANVLRRAWQDVDVPVWTRRLEAADAVVAD